VDEAVSYETATEAEKDYASVLASAPRHAYDGQCTYCGHCKPCPAGIDIAMVNKLYDLASMQPEVPASVRAHYEALERTASDCIGWGGGAGRVCSPAAAARPAVPSMFPWQSGWRRPGRCLRKGNKAVSLLDTKRKLRKWELRGFFCTAMILKFHASLLYFSMIQCKSHQSLWLIGHKQRDVQYITVQLLQGIPAVNQEFWERHWTVLHETDDLRTYSCNYFCPLLTGICPKFPIYSHIFCTINIKNHHKQAERMVKHSFGVKFM